VSRVVKEQVFRPDSAEKGSLYFFLARIVFFATGYLLYFILGRFLLTPEQFGVFGVVLGLIGLTDVVLIHGIVRAVSRFVAARNDLAETIKYKALRLQLAFSGVVFLVYFFSAPFLAAAFNDPEMVLFIQVSAVSILLHPAFSVIRGYLNGLRRFKLETSLASFSRVMRLAMPILFAFLGFSLLGAFIGLAAGMAVSLAVAVAFTGIPKKAAGQDFPSRELALFAVPVIGFSFVQSFLMQVDLFFVKALLPAAELAGHYTAAATLGRLPNEVIATVTLVLFPVMSAAAFKKRLKKAAFYVSQSIRYSAIFAIPSAVALSVTAGQAITLFYGKKYEPGAGPLGILSVAYLFFTFFVLSTTLLIASGRPKKALAVGVTAFAADVLLNALLVPLMGMEGAALASGVSFALGAVLAGLLVSVEYRTFPFKSVAKSAAATLPVAIALALYPMQGIALVAEYVAAGLLYLGLLYALGEVRENDIALVKNMLR
jgi:O-antigen/teichoic acid export membrane protein